MKIFRRKARAKRGFSILEMTIVLLIIMVFLAMSVPFFQNFGSSSGLKNAQREISTILKTARSYAISRNENYEVLFDTSTARNSYSIRRSAAPGVLVDKQFQLAAGITFTATSIIRFSANGGLASDSPNNSVSVTAKGVTKQVTVWAATGAVDMVP